MMSMMAMDILENAIGMTVTSRIVHRVTMTVVTAPLSFWQQSMG
jgi:hypothetical protein